MAFVILDMGYSEDTLQTTSAEEQKILDLKTIVADIKTTLAEKSPKRKDMNEAKPGEPALEGLEELLQEEEATQVEMEAQEERTGRSATSGTEYFT